MGARFATASRTEPMRYRVDRRAPKTTPIHSQASTAWPVARQRTNATVADRLGGCLFQTAHLDAILHFCGNVADARDPSAPTKKSDESQDRRHRCRGGDLTNGHCL